VTKGGSTAKGTTKKLTPVETSGIPNCKKKNRIGGEMESAWGQFQRKDVLGVASRVRELAIRGTALLSGPLEGKCRGMDDGGTTTLDRGS